MALNKSVSPYSSGPPCGPSSVKILSFVWLFVGRRAAICEVSSQAGFRLVWPASLLDWFPAVKGNDKKEILQVLFETFEGDSLGFTGSFLKKEKEKKPESRHEWVTWGRHQHVFVLPLRTHRLEGLNGAHLLTRVR